MIKNKYGLALRLFHTLILGNKFIPELLFDIENLFTKNKREKLKDYNQIYITGLARAGTTILLRPYINQKNLHLILTAICLL